MREGDLFLKKTTVEMRKHSVCEKSRIKNSNLFFCKEEDFITQQSRNMKSLGRKYAQQNLFKCKELHEVVISDEVIKSSKLFRNLKEKIEISQAQFNKNQQQLEDVKEQLVKQIVNSKSRSYNTKLTLWELKNQIFDLRNLLSREEEESYKLEKQIVESQNEVYDENEVDEERQDLLEQEQHEHEESKTELQKLLEIQIDLKNKDEDNEEQLS